MGVKSNVIRRPQSDLLFYSAHLEPGFEYYGDDEARRSAYFLLLLVLLLLLYYYCY